METTSLSAIKFSLPPELEASVPPEARGLERDQVRLMVSNYVTDQVSHDHFYHLDKYLNEGDVLVINTSRTRNSALIASRADGTRIRAAFIELTLTKTCGRWKPVPSMRWARPNIWRMRAKAKS